MVTLRKASFFIASTIALLSSQHVHAYGQIAQVVDANNFCVFLPPNDSADRIISDTEWNAQAFCTGKTPMAKNAGKLKSGFIQSAHFLATDQYVQVTGQIDPSKARLNLTDEGGQMDIKAPKGSSCAGWKYYVNLIEPAGRTYCMRCCNDDRTCNRGISEKGCAHIIPGDYSGPYGDGPTTVQPPASDNDENENENENDENEDGKSSSVVPKPTKTNTKTVSKSKTASKTTKTTIKKSKTTTADANAATAVTANANQASNDEDANNNTDPTLTSNAPIVAETSNGRGGALVNKNEDSATHAVPAEVPSGTASPVTATTAADAKKGELLSDDGTITEQSVNGANNLLKPEILSVATIFITMILFLAF